MGRAKTGSHLERHGERWRVAVKVPPSLRAVVGRAWLKESLPAGTTPRAAETLKWPVVARFKQQLADAKAGTADKGLVADALAYREMLRSEPPPEHDEAVTAAELIAMRAETIEERHGEAAAVAFADIAFGRATPLRSQLQQWFDRKRFSTGYRLDAERALDRFEGWLSREKLSGTVEAVTVEAAARYVHGAFVKAGIHYKTANKDVSCLSSYWRHLAKSLGVKPNPWAEQRLEAPSERHGPRTDKKRPFTDAEVASLLAGLRSPRERDFSMVAALSGMREDEIASLTVADCLDGLFNVGKSKTPAGVRKVPIHPALAPLVVRLSHGKQPGAYLMDGLPDQREGSKRGRGAPVAQAFTRERRRLGVDERSGEQRQSNVDFHSWRRWFIRTAVQAFEAGAVGFTPWTIARVVGHKAEKGEIDGVALPLGMTMARYSGASSAESMRACVEAVALPKEVAV